MLSCLRVEQMRQHVTVVKLDDKLAVDADAFERSTLVMSYQKPPFNRTPLSKLPYVNWRC